MERNSDIAMAMTPASTTISKRASGWRHASAAITDSSTTRSNVMSITAPKGVAPVRRASVPSAASMRPESQSTKNAAMGWLAQTRAAAVTPTSIPQVVNALAPMPIR